MSANQLSRTSPYFFVAGAGARAALPRPFTLETPFRYDWSAGHPEVREGLMLVLEADPALLRPRETQEPVLLAGYHHEWSPQHHTLLLAGRLQDTLSVQNPEQTTLILTPPIPPSFPSYIADPFNVGQDYQSELEIYTVEAQHIFQRERFAFIFGGRYQAGCFDTENINTIPTGSGLPVSWYDNPQEALDPCGKHRGDFKVRVARPLADHTPHLKSARRPATTPKTKRMTPAILLAS